MEWINNNLSVIQFLLTGVFTIVVFVLLLVFVKRKEHELLKAQVQKIKDTYNTEVAHTELAKQVTTLTTKFDALPSSSQINSLEKDVGELKGSVDGMKDLLKNINNHVNMLVENEIKG